MFQTWLESAPGSDHFCKIEFFHFGRKLSSTRKLNFEIPCLTKFIVYKMSSNFYFYDDNLYSLFNFIITFVFTYIVLFFSSWRCCKWLFLGLLLLAFTSKTWVSSYTKNWKLNRLIISAQKNCCYSVIKFRRQILFTIFCKKNVDPIIWI